MENRQHAMHFKMERRTGLKIEVQYGNKSDPVAKELLIRVSCIMAVDCPLPPPRNLQFTSRLRKSSIYPKPFNRTNRYKSFINYALTNYQ